VRKKLPDDLESSLKERLSQFVAAQSEGHWEDVGELLGRRGFRPGTSDQSYTDSYKRRLLRRMEELRMLDFDFSTEDLSITTTAAGTHPIGGLVDRFTAERSSWHLKGTGRFQTSSESWMEETEVIAYRDQGQWYFIPAQARMQDKWEKAHYKESDFTRDRRDEVEVRNNPSAPVEISDVHAYMVRGYPAGRFVTFKLRNKTSKKVEAAFVNVGGGGGGPIAPKGQRTAKDADFTAYVDFCDGMVKKRMFVEEVYFADGSEWALSPTTDQK
jgi:hypothetical protein